MLRSTAVHHVLASTSRSSEDDGALAWNAGGVAWGWVEAAVLEHGTSTHTSMGLGSGEGMGGEQPEEEEENSAAPGWPSGGTRVRLVCGQAVVVEEGMMAGASLGEGGGRDNPYRLEAHGHGGGGGDGPGSGASSAVVAVQAASSPYSCPWVVVVGCFCGSLPTMSCRCLMTDA